MAEQKAQVKAAQRRAKAGKKARLKADKTSPEAREDLTAAHEKVEHEREAPIKTEKALPENRKASSAARLELKRAHEARIKADKGRAEAARAFEVTSTTKTESGEDSETLPKTPREVGAERRASFIVRLTVDAHGEPRRTEVEDVQSGKKETFALLDGERLTAFMRACIGAPVIPEPAVPPASPSVGVEIQVPKPAGQSASLIVSDVRVFHPGAADALDLPIRPGESFVVQVSFQLQGPDARSLTARQSSYEMKVYANKLDSSESKLLTTYSKSLVKDLMEYTAQTTVPGLSPGDYRFVTLVRLDAPIKLIGIHEGPVIQLI